MIFASCKSTEQAAEETTAEVTAPAEETPAEVTPVDNTDILDATETARQSAINEGADKSYAAPFAATDAAFLALKAMDGAKDNSAELADIKARYEAMALAAKAKKLRERISNEGIDENYPDDFARGDKAILEDFDTMVVNPAVSGQELSKKAKEGYDAYNAVIFKTYKKAAIDERKKAVEQKKACDAVRAQVARKDEYKSYADLIQSGDSKYAMQNVEAAYTLYSQATEKFGSLAEDVAAKRAEAQKKIDEAKAKVQASDEYAEKADSEKPLGEEPVAGIEDEGTTLLEADQFDNPDDGVIKIDENIEANPEAEVEK